MNRIQPPKWADRFLEWYCHPAVLEEIQGDIYEIFYRKSDKNPRIANFQFVWNVIRFFRLKNIKKRKRTESYVIQEKRKRASLESSE